MTRLSPDNASMSTEPPLRPGLELLALIATLIERAAFKSSGWRT